ncbi:MAG TPA: ORF6N domain-containing protein [Pyrinomonadaceae bacterium]|nr:ORF6N domain-containing protein [Pyrinomonadaceae bacterium]
MPHKKNLTKTSLSASVQLIERRIYLIRGQKVMLDFDLAELYGVSTSRLNEQVTRNRKRFPEDFMFRLSKEEVESLRSQFVISSSEQPDIAASNPNLRSQIAISSSKKAKNKAFDPNLRLQIATSSSRYGGRRHLPYAFTEQGVAMLSSVLNSDQAIEVNIAIMRAFVRLRQMLETNEELNRKFVAVIRKLSTHDKYFKVVFDELKKLMEKPKSSTRQIGFKRRS